jgi:hypothetical protein
MARIQHPVPRKALTGHEEQGLRPQPGSAGRMTDEHPVMPRGVPAAGRLPVLQIGKKDGRIGWIAAVAERREIKCELNPEHSAGQSRRNSGSARSRPSW